MIDRERWLQSAHSVIANSVGELATIPIFLNVLGDGGYQFLRECQGSVTVPGYEATIKVMKFDWDKNKAAINLSKHGVSFDEAKTIFDDPLYVDFYDPNHSEEEERYLIIGISNQGRLLITSYTERDESTRLISEGIK